MLSIAYAYSDRFIIPVVEAVNKNAENNPDEDVEMKEMMLPRGKNGKEMT